MQQHCEERNNLSIEDFLKAFLAKFAEFPFYAHVGE